MVCVSVNRLTLHLRSYGIDSGDLPGETERTVGPNAGSMRRRRSSWLGISTLEVHDSVLSGDGELSTIGMHGNSCSDGVDQEGDV